MAKRFDDRTSSPFRMIPPPRKMGGELPKVQDALGYLEKVKNRFHNQPQVYNRFLDIMKDFKSQSIDTEGVIERVKDLFAGDVQLILGFNQFLPMGFKINMEEAYPAPLPPNAKAPIEFNHAVQYVAKIKTRFKNEPEIYSEFLDILHDYQAKRTIDEVYGRVQKLFDNQPDLLDEFKCFLPDGNVPKNRSRKGSDDGHGDKKRKEMSPPKLTGPMASEQLNLFDNIKNTIGRSHWSQLMKCLDMYTRKICSREELLSLVEDLLGSTPLLQQFKDILGFNISVETQISYFEFFHLPDVMAQCKQVTPSYREFPKGLREPLCTGRDDLGKEVLNTKYFAMPPTAGRKRQLNVHERELNSVEDQRVSLDVMIRSNAAAIRELENYSKLLSTVDDETTRVPLPPSFGILELRAIARLYGDKGHDMLELLRKCPIETVPLLLVRLRQKDEEWRRGQLELKHQWAETAKEHSKAALDYHAVAVRESLRRKCEAATLVGELRRNSESLSISVMCSPAIHHHVHSIVNSLALLHLVGVRQRNLVHSLWQTVLNPFFGVESLPIHLVRCVSPGLAVMSPPVGHPSTPSHSPPDDLTELTTCPPPLSLYATAPTTSTSTSSSSSSSSTTISSTPPLATTTAAETEAAEAFETLSADPKQTDNAAGAPPKKRAKRGKRRITTRRPNKRANKAQKDAGKAEAEEESEPEEEVEGEEEKTGAGVKSTPPCPSPSHTEDGTSSTHSSESPAHYSTPTNFTSSSTSSSSCCSSSSSCSCASNSAAASPPPATEEVVPMEGSPPRAPRELGWLSGSLSKAAMRRGLSSPDHHATAISLREVHAVSFLAPYKPLNTEPMSYSGVPPRLCASTNVFAVVRLHLFVAQVFEQIEILGQAKWGQFVTLLERRTSGDINDESWNEQLKTLLGGAVPAPVATVDCLVVELLRQAVRVVSDEGCLKELSLYASCFISNETRKSSGSGYETLFSELRAADFYTVLSLDQTTLECSVPPTVKAELPPPPATKTEPYHWNNYTRTYLLLFPHIQEATPSRPFLLRCLRRTKALAEEAKKSAELASQSAALTESYLAPSPEEEGTSSTTTTTTTTSTSTSAASIIATTTSSPNNTTTSTATNTPAVTANATVPPSAGTMATATTHATNNNNNGGSHSNNSAVKREHAEDEDNSSEEEIECSRPVEVMRHRAHERWLAFVKNQLPGQELARLFHQASAARRAGKEHEISRKAVQWRTIHSNLLGAKMEDD